jgi:hypothetical protein
MIFARAGLRKRLHFSPSRLNNTVIVQVKRTLILLCQNSLRQRTGRGLVRRAGEVVWVVGRSQRVVDVNDRGFAILRVDRNLEQVEQITRPRATGSAVGADNAEMIGCGIYLSLCEAGAVELRGVNMPARARIEEIGCIRAIIDNVDSAIVGGNPREQRRSCGRPADCYGRRPGIALVSRTTKRNSSSVRPHRVEVSIDRVDGQRRKNVRQVCARGSGKRDICRPSLAHVAAARNDDVVRCECAALQHTSFTRSVNIVDVMCPRVGHEVSLNVIERRLARR